MTDDEINLKYSDREDRIVTEVNREKLPNFVDALRKKPKSYDVRPFYQRRERWDAARQSRLIESFLMNIPVPPLFLYETRYDSYEVMDGQQRISAVLDFYNNTLVLEGLEHWPELNGRTYSKLPSKIRAGIDRRSISYVVLLTESAVSDEDAIRLKQLVFERLNTGGINLSHQEIRNCVFQGPLNNLLQKLSAHPLFRKAWQMPPPTEEERLEVPDVLRENKLFATMEDVEIVLRFFALRNASFYQHGMQGFLDLYMIRARRFNDEDLGALRELFERTIQLAVQIYEDKAFRPFDAKIARWSDRPQKAFWDAVMVGLSEMTEHSGALVAKRETILERTKELFQRNPEGTFTGRGNTKKDVQERIGLFVAMLNAVLSASN